MGHYTDLLYSRPTFWGGMARCLDMGCTLREFNTSRQPDRLALASDSYAVAEDVRTVIGSRLELRDWAEKNRADR